MAQTDEQLVLAALEVIADPRNLREDDFVTALTERGIDLQPATRLAFLVPLAFGRVLISHLAQLELSTEFLIKESTTETVRPLQGEPLFIEALRIATRMYHSGPRDLFEPAALMSAEVGAVNKVLNSGATLDGGSLARPIFWGTEGVGW